MWADVSTRKPPINLSSTCYFVRGLAIEKKKANRCRMAFLIGRILYFLIYFFISSFFMSSFFLPIGSSFARW